MTIDTDNDGNLVVRWDGRPGRAEFLMRDGTRWIYREAEHRTSVTKILPWAIGELVVEKISRRPSDEKPAQTKNPNQRTVAHDRVNRPV